MLPKFLQPERLAYASVEIVRRLTDSAPPSTMTTRDNPTVVIDARGLVVACSWCLTLPELEALNAQYPGTVSHSLCESCAAVLVKESA
jgi:hypothetical protein